MDEAVPPGAGGDVDFRGEKRKNETHESTIDPWLSIVTGIALIGTYGMAGGVSRAHGEGIGLRRFLVPELAKTTSFTTALISGIVWSLWHYPVLIYGDYNAGTPTWYGLTCFIVMIVSMSFVFAWMV